MLVVLPAWTGPTRRASHPAATILPTPNPCFGLKSYTLNALELGQIIQTGGQSNVVKAASKLSPSPCGMRTYNKSWVPKSLHPKQDFYPSSRFCTAKPHRSLYLMRSESEIKTNNFKIIFVPYARGIDILTLTVALYVGCWCVF